MLTYRCGDEAGGVRARMRPVASPRGARPVSQWLTTADAPTPPRLAVFVHVDTDAELGEMSECPSVGVEADVGEVVVQLR